MKNVLWQIMVILSLILSALPASGQKAEIVDFGISFPDGYSGFKIENAYYEKFNGKWYVTVVYRSTVYVGDIQIIGRIRDKILWWEEKLLFPEDQKYIELKINHSGEIINYFIEFRSPEHLLAQIIFTFY